MIDLATNHKGKTKMKKTHDPILHGHLVRLRYRPNLTVMAQWIDPQGLPVRRKIQRDGTRERYDFIEWAAAEYVEWLNDLEPRDYRLKLQRITVGIYSDSEDVLILHTVEELAPAPAEILVTG